MNHVILDSDLKSLAMKIFLILDLFIFMAMPSLGQPGPNDFILNLKFVPSFLTPAELSIEAKGDSGVLDLRIYKNYRMKEISGENKVIIPVSKLTALTSFLKTYKFRIRNSTDTVGSHREFINGDSVLVYDIERGNDGITVEGLFNQNSMMNKFAFWSPEKGSNAELIAIVINLIDNLFQDQKIEDYIEQLQQYFPHKLGLKKLSDEPLTYKLFGSISAIEANEFYAFLKQLPFRSKVIIDLSNYSGMGTMFYDAFDEYNINRKNIYWLNPSRQGFIELYEIGISNRQIISKKKLVVTKENGREIFSLK
jgi:hypothetical protein